MVVTSSMPFTKKYYGRNWIRFEPFENLIDEDTAYVRNVYVEIAKSPNDSFQVTMKKTARANTKADANNLANLIKFNVEQKDSVLLLEKGIAINKTDKFRNQMVIITVYVPEGKQIRVNKGIGWPVHFGSDNWNDNWNNDYYEPEENIRWQSDVDYIMKADGLYTLDGRKADGWNDRKKAKTKTRIGTDGTVIESGDNYRYNNGEPMNRIDSMKMKLEKEQLKIKDSLQKVKEKIEQQLEKIGNNDEPGPVSKINQSVYDPMMSIN